MAQYRWSLRNHHDCRWSATAASIFCSISHRPVRGVAQVTELFEAVIKRHYRRLQEILRSSTRSLPYAVVGLASLSRLAHSTG